MIDTLFVVAFYIVITLTVLSWNSDFAHLPPDLPRSARPVWLLIRSAGWPWRMFYHVGRAFVWLYTAIMSYRQWRRVRREPIPSARVVS
jgi:hypothetical protein